MPAYAMNDITRQGVAAARGGDRVQARQLLTMATKLDDSDIVAWWWLGEVMDDLKSRHKCHERAQTAAAKTEEGRATFRELIREAGAPSLPRYRLGPQSKSNGDTCPICTIQMVPNDEIVLCTSCHRANHSECWEANVFHCGNLGCGEPALLDNGGMVRTEAAAKTESIRIDSSEIPDSTPWASRETQEVGFVNRLRQQARQAQQAMAAREFRRRLLEGIHEQVRRQEAEEKARTLVRWALRGLCAGLLLGIAAALAAFRYTQNWAVALLTVYMAAAGLMTAARNACFTAERLTTFLYWLIPQIVGGVLVWVVFRAWASGFVATVLSLAGMLLATRVLRTQALANRRAFVAYSAWFLLVIALVRVALKGG